LQAVGDADKSKTDQKQIENPNPWRSTPHPSNPSVVAVAVPPLPPLRIGMQS